MKVNFYLLIFLFFLKSFCFAGGEGSSAVPFLKIPVGARAAALGGAFTAISDDASGIFSNPAGLSFAKSKELALSHNQWIEGLGGETIAYVHPLNSKFAFGAGINVLLSGSMKKYDLNGVQNGEFNYSEGAALAGVSRSFVGGSAGMALKTVYQKSENKNATAFAVDAGIMSAFHENFRAGLSVENMGAKIKLEEDAFPLPRGFKLALAYMPLKYRFITAQIKKYSDENAAFSAGAEQGFDISARETVFLRAGYASGADENTGSGLNFGFGLKAKEISIDYAFSPMGDFGFAHRVSFSIAFSRKIDESREKKKYRPKKKSRPEHEKEDFFIW